MRNMTAKVIYEGGLRTIDTHLQSGTVIETDAPTDNQGKGERFSPTDLLATSLGTCIVTTMAILGRNHNIDIEGTECDVEKIMASNPRRVAEIKVHLHFPKNKSYTDKEKTILEHIANTCPVSLSLHPDCKQTLSFNWG
jgi:uncharacterized OsmC-like protein